MVGTGVFVICKSGVDVDVEVSVAVGFVGVRVTAVVAVAGIRVAVGARPVKVARTRCSRVA